MDKIGFIEIRITGTMGNFELTPDSYDIREVSTMLENAEKLLHTGDKKDRPLISYNIENGSIKHIFKTSMQYIIGFNAILGQVAQQNNIDFLDLTTAKAFENIQEQASKKDYAFSIATSIQHSNQININRSTSYKRTESIWAEAEFYFYGKVTNAGGKDKANIHVSTSDFGTIRIQTPISFLVAYENNILYKSLGIRATGRQQSETGEIDFSTLKFIELVDYSKDYDEAYLKNLRNKAKKNWLANIDADDWLKSIRGYGA